MTEQPLSIKASIDRISDPDEELTTKQLSLLSRLSDEDTELFAQTLSRVSAARRLQIISRLVYLCEADVVLDFSKIFLFCMNDPDQFTRAQAATGLSQEQNEQYIAPLIRAIESDSSPVVRAAVAKGLGVFALQGELDKIPARYTDQVYAALENILLSQIEPEDVKNKALLSIAFLSRPKIVEFIEEAYYSGNSSTKINALYAMGNTCNPRWLEILFSELGNEKEEVRLAAVHACGEIGNEEAIPFLIDTTEDTEATVQEAAIQALGEIGGEEAREALNALAGSPRRRMRKAAETALKELDTCDDPLSLIP